MRVAIDARYVADHFPGIGRYVFNLIDALAGLDPPGRLLVLYNPHAPATRHHVAALAGHSCVELLPLAARPFSLAEHLRIPVLLRQAGADLYHAPYYIRPYVGLPCPSVVTLYDLIPRLFPAESSLRARLLFDTFTRLAIRSAQHVIAISASARADLLRFYRLAPDAVTVTPLAAGPGFRPQPPDVVAHLRARYNLPERYVLVLSSNVPHKNLPRLIEAWALYLKRVAPARAPLLLIAGHQNPRYPQVDQLVAARGLDQQVRVMPHVPEADLPALYSGATLFVFPSLYEGFGLPPLEALACGTPVVCGAVSSLPEVVGAAGLLVDVRSPEALAAAIERLLADAALRDRLAAAALEQAARFSWEATARITREVYAQVLARAPG